MLFGFSLSWKLQLNVSCKDAGMGACLIVYTDPFTCWCFRWVRSPAESSWRTAGWDGVTASKRCVLKDDMRLFLSVSSLHKSDRFHIPAWSFLESVMSAARLFLAAWLSSVSLLLCDIWTSRHRAVAADVCLQGFQIIRLRSFRDAGSGLGQSGFLLVLKVLGVAECWSSVQNGPVLPSQSKPVLMS